MGWVNFKDKLKRYAIPEPFEVKGLIMTIIVTSFIFSFRAWGGDQFDFFVGLENLFIITLLVGLAYLVHELAHRSVALIMGYRSQYKAWILGLVIGLVLVFISNGRLIFLAPGALIIGALAYHKIGKFPNVFTYKHAGWIAMSAPIANMLLAIVFKMLSFALPADFVQKAIMINIWIALYDMLPIPPYNGSKTFYGSRYIYIFTLGALIGCAALLTYFSSLASVLGALFLGAVATIIFFVEIDKQW